MPNLRHLLTSIPGGVRLWASLLSFGFLFAALLANAPQLLALRLDAQGWLWLVIGTGVSLLSLVVNGLAWSVGLYWLGAQPRWDTCVRLYLRSNLLKYLPGGFWHLASRVQSLRAGPPAPVADLPPPQEPHPLASRAPVGTALALMAVLLDPLLAASAALALVPLGGWQDGLALLAPLPLIGLLPRWSNRLLGRLQRQRARQLSLEDGTSTLPPVALPGYPLLPLLAQFPFVLLRFAGFACAVMAFDQQLALSWPLWLAGFALAWTAGLVVPGAPGGLGVFEAVLVLRLGAQVPEPPLLAVALSYRVLVTVADLLGALTARLDERLAGERA
jgi:glycosyltransferase 2 family protein